MSGLLSLSVAVPLVGAGVSMIARGHPVLQRVVGAVALIAALGIDCAVFAEVDNTGVVATQLGGWPAPFGITLVADRFSAIMLVVGAVMVLGVFLYAVGEPRTHDEATWFHPVYLVLAAGVSASFLAGDLFNLFVAFEVMLNASYVLLTLGGQRDQVRSGMTYVVISLVASLLFITGIGLVYAAAGSVNMADLAGRIAELPEGLQIALGGLFLVVFGIKAAVFPLFFWLPDSYPTAPAPISAVFAGLLTKVGVYAIVRTQTLLFPGERLSTVILVAAALTMSIAIFGALAQGEIKRILSFNLVSHIGFMVFGLGLFSLAGMAAAIFYVVHHIVVKTSLFLVGGLVEQVSGTGRLEQLGGMLRRAPVVAALFAVSALSLAGMPPFSGFIAKLALVQAGLDAGQAAMVAISLVVSLLTLVSMSQIWTATFWGPAPEAGPSAAKRVPVPPLMLSAAVGLVALSVAVAVAGQPLYAFSERAAADLLDPSAYRSAVLAR